MTATTNKSTVLQWELKWDLATPTSSWASSKTNCSPTAIDQNLIFTNAITMTASALFHPAQKNLTYLLTQSFFFHPALKYTWEISKNSLAFLDIKLAINDNGLSTSVHYKPTDSNNYLLHSSSHPQHVKNAIPLPQFLRLSRLCSEDTDLSSKCEDHRQTPGPKKSTERQHYKLHRTKKPTEFHSPLPTSHKTLQSKTSFSKTLKFSVMIPKLNTYFLYHHSSHSSATKA